MLPTQRAVGGDGDARGCCRSDRDRAMRARHSVSSMRAHLLGRLEERDRGVDHHLQPQVAHPLPVVRRPGGTGVNARRHQPCSSDPSAASTFFSPASTANGKRFCFGGSGQLNA